jgi:N-methylhydantoinase A
VTTDRGLDPGAFPNLFAYGGAGPLHATMVARELALPRVIIPRAPGHFSAFGMLLADFRKDVVRTQFTSLAQTSVRQLSLWFNEIETQARASLKASQLRARKVVVQRFLDMRYVGQEHAVTVEIPASAFVGSSKSLIKQAFDEAHRERYGRGSPSEPAEIVSIRSVLTGVLKKPLLEQIPAGSRTPPRSAWVGERRAYFSGAGWLSTPVWRREELKAGNVIRGAALIEEHASTTVLQPGDVLRVDALGNLCIAIAQGASA